MHGHIIEYAIMENTICKGHLNKIKNDVMLSVKGSVQTR